MLKAQILCPDHMVPQLKRGPQAMNNVRVILHMSKPPSIAGYDPSPCKEISKLGAEEMAQW